MNRPTAKPNKSAVTYTVGFNAKEHLRLVKAVTFFANISVHLVIRRCARGVVFFLCVVCVRRKIFLSVCTYSQRTRVVLKAPATVVLREATINTCQCRKQTKYKPQPKCASASSRKAEEQPVKGKPATQSQRLTSSKNRNICVRDCFACIAVASMNCTNKLI